MQQLKKRKRELETKLKKKKGDQVRSQKARENKKKKLNAALKEKTRISSGRPPLEEELALLLKTIIDIAMRGSASQDKRQNDMYRSVKTLDQLKEQLKSDGFVISRSGIYLQPRCSSSLESKRHVKTVPGKLIRAQNDDHTKHVDGEFCTATITHSEKLSSILGPKKVCFISQDDKCRVSIGVTAANKQSPLLMHVEYRISLPDHDWVVADQHKIIPSVYAGIRIMPDGLGNKEAVSYSGS